MLITFLPDTNVCLTRTLCLISHGLQGIGDSGQGMTNAILFVLCTEAIRNSVWRRIHCCRKAAGGIQGSGSVYHDSDADVA